jgi:propionate CoA-transferase
VDHTLCNEDLVEMVDFDGVELIEIAPGIQIEKDILPHMDFVPIIKEVEEMDGELFI